MPSFGENLKREREMRGVTLEEMSETTKISVRLLGALERDRFSELPGGVFTRSFIRAYAQYLGLDEEHVLAEYKGTAKPSSDNDLSRLTPSRALTDKGSRTRVLPWMIIAALLGSGYAVYRYSRRSLDGSANSARSPLPSPAPASPATAPPPSTGASQPNAQPTGPGSASGQDTQSALMPNGSGTAGEKANTAGNPQVSPNQSLDGTNPETPGGPAAARNPDEGTGGVPVLGEGDMVLQVTTSEEAWVAVAADGKTLMQHLLPANSTRIFRAKNGFDVTTGNAQGTVLTFNGAAQKSLGREGEFKRIHLARTVPEPQPH